MRSIFTEWYRPDDAEFAALWQDALIVLDTNVLLALYQYRADVRNEYVNVLTELKPRLWMPYQVGLEYHRNRVRVIQKERDAVVTLRKQVTESEKTIANAVNNWPAHHAHIDRTFAADLLRAFRTTIQQLQDAESACLSVQGTPDDPIRTIINGLFPDDQIGHPPDMHASAAWEKEANARAAKQIPPGYKDIGKADGRGAGDYIVWCQMIEIARERQRPMIFVTNDHKEDWWELYEGHRLGPRPELRHEFRSMTQQVIHFYSADQFLKQAQTLLQRQSTPEVIIAIQETPPAVPWEATLGADYIPSHANAQLSPLARARGFTDNDQHILAYIDHHTTAMKRAATAFAPVVEDAVQRAMADRVTALGSALQSVIHASLPTPDVAPAIYEAIEAALRPSSDQVHAAATAVAALAVQSTEPPTS